jgi:hypothetical protein
MSRHGWLSAGLFLTTLATLLVEILDSRLLSVLTWYHLSFFAVSLAMLGMAAGAVFVFLRGASLSGDRAAPALARAGLSFALAVPITHVFNLVIPLPSLAQASTMAAMALLATTVMLTVPFFLSGVAVTIALTRTGARIGWLYGWDLVGAAIGALLVVPLLDRLNLSSAILAAAAIAAAGAFCFARYAAARAASGLAARPAGVRARRRGWATALLAGLLAWGAWMNGADHRGISVRFSKDKALPANEHIAVARWNSHSFILIGHPGVGEPVYWGAGASVAPRSVSRAWMVIDGEAATAITEWHGDRAALDWVRHDVTSLPHHLRRGSAAVIGVGGGRDVLSALWAGNDRIVGVEINGVLLDMLTRTHRTFAGIADAPAVELVHDEARSYLSRTSERFDVLQMSLIDTWAATGAGAFTLTENGLYTREAWQTFLGALKPGGIFSVSRWFSPADVSETNRLLALGVAALIEAGAEDPRSQLLLVSRGPVATLMLSTQPFTAEDRAALSRVAAQEEFDLLATPWSAGAIERLERIANARTLGELHAAVADPFFDFSPPTDQRPYFFNILKPSRDMLERVPGEGIAWGNLGATMTLAALCGIAAVLVAAIILLPLVATGIPRMPAASFAAALAYFATIGSGYMLVQIPFLQRFSVLLGHPTYTFAIILFSMILFTGIGSFLSDRVGLGRRVIGLPAAIAAALLAIVLLLDPAIRWSARLDLMGRTLVVLAFTGPISLLLGACFPVGMRLVGRLSDAATAWMWGVNGACGVIASVVAVAVSMWVGIDTNLLAAAALYAALTVPLLALTRTRQM